MKKHILTTALVSAVALTLSAVSFAQSDNNDIEEIQVIGTATGTSIRGVAPVGAPVLSIGQDELMTSVSADTTDFLKNLPQGSSLGDSQEVQDTGGNVGFSNGVNLRGLGANATLVLFDGHRLVGQGITESFADPNQLPISAIRRVEVITDGASAVYGSDAVAGVVNYILHDEFDGAEINIRRTEGLYSSTAVDLLLGTTWDTGNAWIGFLHEDRGTFLKNESPFLSDDLTRYGGADNRIDGTNATPGAGAHIVANGTIYGVPDTNGAMPTAAEVLALDGVFDLADSADYQNYWPERQRTAVSVRLRQDLLDGDGRISVTGLYSKRESQIDQFNTFRRTTVRNNSPHWIPGITAASSYQMAYSYAYNNTGPGSRPILNEPVDESMNVYVDFTYDFADDWQLGLNYSWGENESCGRCGPRANTRVQDAGFSPTIQNNDGVLYSDLFNPFLRGPQAAFLEDAFGPQFQETSFGMDRFTAKVDGPLIELPAGDLRIAAGIEHEKTTQSLFLYGNGRTAPPADFVLRDTASSRTVDSAFLEAYIPVTDALILSAAVRYDDYSDAGNTTNPRLAFTYNLTDEVSFRGTWGTAFRAPTLVETNPGVLEQIQFSNLTNLEAIDIPVTNAGNSTSQMLNRLGNTPGLQPEEADFLSFGIDFVGADSPWTASATYYAVEYKGRIQDLPNQPLAIASAENRALYDSFITVAPQPATCVEGDESTYNPAYTPFLTSPNLQNRPSTWGGDCNLQGILYGGILNVGQVNQSGVDLQLGYAWSTDLGEFSTSVNVAKLLNVEFSILPGTPLIDALGSIGEQNELRATANLRWRNGNWAAGASARYVGSYTNDLPATVNGVTFPESTVPSWTTIATDLSYTIPVGEGEGLLDGLRLGMTIDNVFDKDPPVVLSSRLSGAVDQANHNILGRIWSFNVQKKF